jgi:hypothetical protein
VPPPSLVPRWFCGQHTHRCHAKGCSWSTVLVNLRCCHTAGHTHMADEWGGAASPGRCAGSYTPSRRSTGPPLPRQPPQLPSSPWQGPARNGQCRRTVRAGSLQHGSMRREQRWQQSCTVQLSSRSEWLDGKHASRMPNMHPGWRMITGMRSPRPCPSRQGGMRGAELYRHRAVSGTRPWSPGRVPSRVPEAACTVTVMNHSGGYSPQS